MLGRYREQPDLLFMGGNYAYLIICVKYNFYATIIQNYTMQIMTLNQKS